MTEQLRSLPSVDAVLRQPKIEELRQQHSHALVTKWVRISIDNYRKRVLAGDTVDSLKTLESIAYHVIDQSCVDRGQSVQQVINATGIVLHTNLGRAPLAERAIDRLNRSTGYASVELNLETGRRSRRGERVTGLMAQLTGAEEALVVNNCAAATMLVLQTLAMGREVIVSRGQLVEIGGGFRLPDVFRAAGARLREVGTTNRTYVRDYESAMGDQTGAIIRVHRSNFFQTGFVTEPTIKELVSIKRPDTIPVIDDLGSGCIHDLSPLGIKEPTVQKSVQFGADLTLFSGDKLFGGPQSGIIVGRKRWIEVLRESPMMRATRVDKLTLAALEATTEIHLAGTEQSEIPILNMIATDSNQVRQRCDRVVAGLDQPERVQIVPCESQIGGGSVPDSMLASFGLKISCPNCERIAHRLRTGTSAVQGRVSEDHLLLDLRTVADDQVNTLIQQLDLAIRDEDGEA